MATKKRCEACEEVELYGLRNRNHGFNVLLRIIRRSVVEQRCRFQWSQNELAKRTNLSRSTIGAFERGDTISFLNFVKITSALKMEDAWGAFQFYAENNEETKNMCLSLTIMQTRPTRSKAAKARDNIYSDRLV
jgi:DNA-binding XRE family transcriptional regulator